MQKGDVGCIRPTEPADSLDCSLICWGCVGGVGVGGASIHIIYRFIHFQSNGVLSRLATLERLKPIRFDFMPLNSVLW